MMTKNNLKIAILLPARENFSPENAGAIALCVRDFVLHSRYRETTTVFGGTDHGFTEVQYQKIIPQKKWYQRANYSYTKAFISTIQGQGFTHVEVHNRVLSFNYLYKKLPKSTKLSIHFHNDPFVMKALKTKAARQRLINRAAVIYCVSEFIKMRLLMGGLDPKGKVHVVHNGIDLPAQHTKEKMILYVGRIIQEKGALPLAMALKLAQASLKDWRIVFVGNDKANRITEYEKATHSILQELGDACLYTGFISHQEALNYFARAEIAVVPSVWQEPFGRTALEAMAYSCGLISSDSGGLKEIAADAALILKEVTPEAIAEALIKLVNDGELRKELQLRARERVEKYFNIAKLTARLDQLRAS